MSHIDAIHVLLQGRGGGGILVLIVFLVFWGISALGSLAKKQRQRDLQMLERIRQSGTTPAPRRVFPVEPSAPILRRLPNPSIGKGIRTRGVVPIAKQKTSRRADPALQRVVTAAPTGAPIASKVETAAPIAPVRSNASRASAPAIAKWLKPETLRSQFILTEIFQPPVAMRGDVDRRFP